MIEAIELQKHFGPVRAVSNLSFTALKEYRQDAKPG
jgi:hypothetical protein